MSLVQGVMIITLAFMLFALQNWRCSPNAKHNAVLRLSRHDGHDPLQQASDRWLRIDRCRPSGRRRSRQRRRTVYAPRAEAHAGTVWRAARAGDDLLHRRARNGGAAVRSRSKRRGDPSVLHLRLHRQRGRATRRDAGVRGYSAGMSDGA